MSMIDFVIAVIEHIITITPFMSLTCLPHKYNEDFALYFYSVCPGISFAVQGLLMYASMIQVLVLPENIWYNRCGVHGTLNDNLQ